MKRSLAAILLAALLALASCGGDGALPTTPGDTESETANTSAIASENEPSDEESPAESSIEDESPVEESSAAPEESNPKLVTDLFDGGIPLIKVGERIFYTKNKMLAGSVELDGSGRILYPYDGLDCIGVTDRRIFCIDTKNGDKLCAMNYDGSGLTIVYDKACERCWYHTYYDKDRIDFRVLDKVVGIEAFFSYYTVSSDGDLLTDAVMNRTLQEDGWIYTNYYHNEYETTPLIKHRPDGSEAQYLTDFAVERILSNDSKDVFDGWVYYILNGPGIYRIRTDGTDNQKVCDDRIFGETSYYIDGDYIYYQNAADPIETNDPNSGYQPCCLYSVKVDGSEKTKLLSENVNILFSKNGTVYYQLAGRDVTQTIFAINHDGTNKRAIKPGKDELLLLTDDGFFFSRFDVNTCVTDIYYYEF